MKLIILTLSSQAAPVTVADKGKPVMEPLA
jgi:hypothetical protein